MRKSAKLKKSIAIISASLTTFAIAGQQSMCLHQNYSITASASDSAAHDTSRNVQNDGVGNPFNYGERNTPANGSTAEIRAINHAMTVQQVKYSLYKEIDEHWDLLKVRLGQTDREKVYALFIGLATRESTLGGNGDGGDLETAYQSGFGVDSADAYGPIQTAVTAFAGCNPTFMKEEDVPEMFQYTFNESNFYDCIISNHMGIRKILHFVNLAINDYNLSGYQVVRAALKGFNTGWATYTGENDGYYKNYPDEIIALAHWYYDNGHLYDNVFTWTNDEKASSYRQDPWGWWNDVKPSMAPVSIDSTEPTTSATTSATVTTTTETTTSQQTVYGDVNCDATVDISDVVSLRRFLVSQSQFPLAAQGSKNADVQGNLNGINAQDAVIIQQYVLGMISKMPVE